MKRYESYKDSGVKWLGEIPGHWEVKRFRFLFSENKTKNTKLKEKKQLQFRYGEIVPKERQDIDEESSKIISKYTIVKERDIIINGLNLNYDFISQRVAMVRESGIITSAYISLRSKIELITCFYNYFMKAMDSRMLFHGMGSGIRLTLSYDNLKNLFFPYPDIAEQTAIANYLDSVTSKIDEAISQQQKMIDLLNERKQIIIQNAVTKGLDPNAKMKDSGVEWIGEIPEDWEVLKLRRISKIFTGKTPSTSNPRYFHSEDIEWFTPGDFNGIELKSSKRKISNYAIKDNASILYPKHSIFIIGIGGTIGKVAFCDLDASCNQQINVIILNENANYRYITYLLQNSNSEIMKNANLSTLPIINQQKTGDLKIILPNINEQSLIVDYINNEIKPIDSSISQCNKMISLLQERKQIIINDVVTGKVKVI